MWCPLGFHVPPSFPASTESYSYRIQYQQRNWGTTDPTLFFILWDGGVQGCWGAAMAPVDTANQKESYLSECVACYQKLNPCGQCIPKNHTYREESNQSYLDGRYQGNHLKCQRQVWNIIKMNIPVEIPGLKSDVYRLVTSRSAFDFKSFIDRSFP